MWEKTNTHSHAIRAGQRDEDTDVNLTPWGHGVGRADPARAATVEGLQMSGSRAQFPRARELGIPPSVLISLLNLPLTLV